MCSYELSKIFFGRQVAIETLIRIPNFFFLKIKWSWRPRELGDIKIFSWRFHGDILLDAWKALLFFIW